jgi:hypothetical protein
LQGFFGYSGSHGLGKLKRFRSEGLDSYPNLPKIGVGAPSDFLFENPFVSECAVNVPFF